MFPVLLIGEGDFRADVRTFALMDSCLGGCDLEVIASALDEDEDDEVGGFPLLCGLEGLEFSKLEVVSLVDNSASRETNEAFLLIPGRDGFLKDEPIIGAVSAAGV